MTSAMDASASIVTSQVATETPAVQSPSTEMSTTSAAHGAQPPSSQTLEPSNDGATLAVLINSEHVEESNSNVHGWCSVS
ncbi:hypothetical protein BD626DRAFT_575400 [Schizophyllum amplum]|uniref:Uncharacterized protein n=1 Tax=Schizophyllum amplum TaxID=97359 RepID=A0A550BVU1_9AGAR|nr:hypothetical protein BD626DRAFT_575400 [Auriculariopsis ampla]